jgi:hypothetical protein
MDKFEYMQIGKFSMSVDKLNELGAEGWELITIVAPVVTEVWIYYFKRKCLEH